MIWQDTFLTFVDLNRFAVPMDEFAQIVRTKRGRMIGGVRLELKSEGEPKTVYAVIVKSGFATAGKTGNTSMVVYYLEVSSAAAGGRDPAGEMLNQNQVKMFDALPDSAAVGKDSDKSADRSASTPKSTLNKNQFHEYLEKKIKELGKKFRN